MVEVCALLRTVVVTDLFYFFYLSVSIELFVQIQIHVKQIELIQQIFRIISCSESSYLYFTFSSPGWRWHRRSTLDYQTEGGT